MHTLFRRTTALAIAFALLLVFTAAPAVYSQDTVTDVPTSTSAPDTPAPSTATTSAPPPASTAPAADRTPASAPPAGETEDQIDSVTLPDGTVTDDPAKELELLKSLPGVNPAFLAAIDEQTKALDDYQITADPNDIVKAEDAVKGLMAAPSDPASASSTDASTTAIPVFTLPADMDATAAGDAETTGDEDSAGGSSGAQPTVPSSTAAPIPAATSSPPNTGTTTGTAGTASGTSDDSSNP